MNWLQILFVCIYIYIYVTLDPSDVRGTVLSVALRRMRAASDVSERCDLRTLYSREMNV